jgi:hypothetical protein
MTSTLRSLSKVHHDSDPDIGKHQLTRDSGAHAYLLHQILHDYPDETCRKILQQIKPAMESRSKILINEVILPEQGTHWLTTSLDLGVMACLAARERTEEQFIALFASVGLEMTGIWKHPEGVDSIMEVTLPKS